jgi:hypothetical protein
MDYKVILFNVNAADETDTSGNFEFYTHNEAEAVCIAWVALANTFKAYLWNGETWRYFA